MKYFGVFVLLVSIVFGNSAIWIGPADGAEAVLSEATFYVAWYDVGKAALEGLPGVESVSRGFSGGREINTVTYDPDEISMEAMVKALKDAVTYRGTAKD